MATTYLHPGVYVEELQGPQQITGTTTSTAVFVGATEIAPNVAPPGGPKPQLVTSWNDYVSKFGGFLWGAHVPFAVYNFFAQGGSICYVLPASPTGSRATVDVGKTFSVTATTPGTWGNDLAVSIDNFPPDPPGAGPATPDKPVFTFRVLCKTPAPQSASTADKLITHYATINDLPVVVQQGVQYWILEEYVGLTAADLVVPPGGGRSPFETKVNVQSLFVRVAVEHSGVRPGNTHGLEPLANGQVVAPVNYAQVLGALDARDDVNLLALPDMALLDDPGKHRDCIQAALTYCERQRPRRDLFVIADPPFGLDPTGVCAFKTGEAPQGNALTSSYGALYYPWIDFMNGVTRQLVPMPPSGAIAGTYAATDQRVGVFKAPAGIVDGKLDVAVGLERLVTATEQDVLNPNGINAIRPLQRFGICTYGARTLSTDPSLTYVNVRRVLTYIETSLYWGTQWVVFEPNDQRLWGAITRDVTEFLTTLWQQGALFGATLAQAFSVQCDEHNNPPAARNQGQLFIDILVAPVRPAEFVVIRIQQATLGSS